MTRFLLLAALLLAPLAVVRAADPSAPARKPNIVVFLFDDLGFGQPPSYAAESALRTPNFDRLAAQGMRFTDAHSAAAVCTPTRYGLLTGRYPARIGQFGVLGTRSPPIIPTTRLTVASMLKRQGYATACIGKWHLGMNWMGGKSGPLVVGDRITEGPTALGFDFFYGYTHARNIATVIEQDRVVATLAHEHENQPLLIAKAVDWIGKRRSDEPFFLYVPVCPPHTPIAPAPEYVGRSGAQDVVKHDPRYGDWVYQGDAMLGQIMDALEQNDLADDTLLMVSADNGAAGRSYPPLRASKASIYEGGHRVPCVVRWPGRVKAGTTWNHTICLNDLMATAAEITAATLPPDAAEDSVSFLPALLGTTDVATREATVHQSFGRDLAIRQGPWKAVFLANGTRELYNLADDVGETRNLAATNPDVMARLTALFQRYIDEGRSTPGELQLNEFALSLDPKPRRTKKPRNP